MTEFIYSLLKKENSSPTSGDELEDEVSDITLKIVQVTAEVINGHINADTATRLYEKHDDEIRQLIRAEREKILSELEEEIEGIKPPDILKPKNDMNSYGAGEYDGEIHAINSILNAIREKLQSNI